MVTANHNGEQRPGVLREIWLGACLIFFGLVIGVMAALNEQVGSTAALIAALFTLIGGTLAALYRPANLPDAARTWIVQAAGLISLGLLIGLCVGFGLRYYDQAYLMTGIARERAKLDRELRNEGQRLSDFWGEHKDKGETNVSSPKPSTPLPSVTLRAGFEELRDAAVQELNAVILRLQETKGSSVEQGRAKQILADLKIHVKVLGNPKDHSPGYLLAHIEMAESALAELKEESARKRLQDLREKGLEK